MAEESKQQEAEAKKKREQEKAQKEAETKLEEKKQQEAFLRAAEAMRIKEPEQAAQKIAAEEAIKLREPGRHAEKPVEDVPVHNQTNQGQRILDFNSTTTFGHARAKTLLEHICREELLQQRFSEHDTLISSARPAYLQPRSLSVIVSNEMSQRGNSGRARHSSEGFSRCESAVPQNASPSNSRNISHNLHAAGPSRILNNIEPTPNIGYTTQTSIANPSQSNYQQPGPIQSNAIQGQASIVSQTVQNFPSISGQLSNYDPSKHSGNQFRVTPSPQQSSNALVQLSKPTSAQVIREQINVSNAQAQRSASVEQPTHVRGQDERVFLANLAKNVSAVLTLSSMQTREKDNSAKLRMQRISINVAHLSESEMKEMFQGFQSFKPWLVDGIPESCEAWENMISIVIFCKHYFGPQFNLSDKLVCVNKVLSKFLTEIDKTGKISYKVPNIKVKADRFFRESGTSDKLKLNQALRKLHDGSVAVSQFNNSHMVQLPDISNYFHVVLFEAALDRFFEKYRNSAAVSRVVPPATASSSNHMSIRVGNASKFCSNEIVVDPRRSFMTNSAFPSIQQVPTPTTVSSRQCVQQVVQSPSDGQITITSLEETLEIRNESRSRPPALLAQPPQPLPSLQNTENPPPPLPPDDYPSQPPPPPPPPPRDFPSQPQPPALLVQSLQPAYQNQNPQPASYHHQRPLPALLSAQHVQHPISQPTIYYQQPAAQYYPDARQQQAAYQNAASWLQPHQSTSAYLMVQANNNQNQQQWCWQSQYQNSTGQQPQQQANAPEQISAQASSAVEAAVRRELRRRENLPPHPPSYRQVETHVPQYHHQQHSTNMTHTNLTQYPVNYVPERCQDEDGRDTPNVIGRMVSQIEMEEVAITAQTTAPFFISSCITCNKKGVMMSPCRSSCKCGDRFCSLHCLVSALQYHFHSSKVLV
ncbi:Hypothetical predicted protein [Cloeon dipterum]|uniref:TFIIS central domain-containing protein n=1 Tax=Cloeon dipterum TaxID=197152 RepID=A0A8S1BVA3_9INSE|nr:Hypothetical predicted protein [Cloeon dipterum]